MSTTKAKRSPNYPAIALEEAIAKARMIYKEEHQYSTDKEVIAKHLGYNGLNGASLTQISAIAKYGLLENTGPKQLKISEAAEEIFYLEEGDPRYVELLRKAAFTPPLFSELREAFPEKLPSDQTLRLYLIKKEFNPKIVDSVIRVYRDTLEFVNNKESIASSKVDGKNLPLEETMPTQHSSNTHSNYPSNTDAVRPHRAFQSEQSTFGNSFQADVGQSLQKKSFQYPITESCTAYVEFDGEITLDGIQTLIESLNLFAKILTPKETQKDSKTDYSAKADYWQDEQFEFENDELDEEDK